MWYEGTAKGEQFEAYDTIAAGDYLEVRSNFEDGEYLCEMITSTQTFDVILVKDGVDETVIEPDQVAGYLEGKRWRLNYYRYLKIVNKHATDDAIITVIGIVTKVGTQEHQQQQS